MKIRRLPADFQVEELNSLQIGRQGSHAVYQLKKTDWTTLDALKSIARTWKLSPRQIMHAGLKDRHAVTSQLITIAGGPRRNLEQSTYQLEYLGQSPRATCSQDILGNRFRLAIRSLTSAACESAQTVLPDLEQTGLANYFDNQRFGSYIPSEPFIAEHWLRGDFEAACRLALAIQHPDDPQQEVVQKQLLREHWGDWKTCKAVLARSHRRSIVTFLDDRPGDFKGAWARVDAQLRGLYLSAFQSHLWNSLLSLKIQELLPPEQRVEFPLRTLVACLPLRLQQAQRDALLGLEIPLPAARSVIPETPEFDWYRPALEALGWPLERIKVSFPRDRFFSRALRSAWIAVQELDWSFEEDELDQGRQKLNLHFQLPRGCYATMVIKRLFPDAAWHAEPQLDEESQTPS